MAKVFTITEGLENMGALRTGGQGSVYKGKRMGPIITAVKLLPTPIHTEDENDKNFRDFQNEVEKLKKVNQEPNPNVVKILNSGITESGSLPFIEMEFIEGPDVEELLKAPNDPIFSIREVIKVADQLSNALAHCHKFSIKHGDIKSNNVKFNIHSGNYMLLDFGLAVMSDEQRRTSLRHAGAIEFMAPEQNSGEMLFETDVYSFGVVLFELLTGQVPFPLLDSDETSRNQVMISHMETPLPDILELRFKNLPANWPEEKKAVEMFVPSWLLAIISKCLEKQPGNRFKNGMELHEAIVVNSVSAVDLFENHTDSNDITVLQNENARLKSLLLQYQKALEKKDTPTLAASQDNDLQTNAGAYTLETNKRSFGLKPVAILLLIIVFTALGVFAGYSIFNSQHPANTIDTVAINMEKQRLSDSIAELKRLNEKRIQDSINNAQKVKALQQKVAAQQAEQQQLEENNAKKKKGLFNKIFKKREK